MLYHHEYNTLARSVSVSHLVHKNNVPKNSIFTGKARGLRCNTDGLLGDHEVGREGDRVYVLSSRERARAIGNGDRIAGVLRCGCLCVCLVGTNPCVGRAGVDDKVIVGRGTTNTDAREVDNLVVNRVYRLNISRKERRNYDLQRRW
jgi:hypothetical protein